MPLPVNVLVKLSPARRRMAKSMKRLIDIATNSDTKLYVRGGVFLPIFDVADDALMAALLVVSDRLTAVINPVRGDP